MQKQSADIHFGESQFKGQQGAVVDLYRWWIQFVSLLAKNVLILWRRPMQLLICLLLPSALSFVFLMQMHDADNGGSKNDYPSIPIADIGACDVYRGSKCVRVVYGPSVPATDAVMQTFSDVNNLHFGSDVRGFVTIDDAQEYVADHIGAVQFTVFFRNESLWETYHYSPTGGPLPKNMSYVIFYNQTRDNDPRSKKYGVNFPLLVVQKTLEESYLRNAYGPDFTEYTVNFGDFWSLPYDNTANETLVGTNYTKCDWESRYELTTIGTTAPWVIIFQFLLLANVFFQLVAEERRKRLFASLRRLGLMDSAYWLSWFLVFQVVIVVGAGIAVGATALVQSHSSALAAIDLRAIYLLMWLSGSASMSFAMFLSAFCSSSSVETSLAFTQFLVALLTVAAATSPLNKYQYMDGDDDQVACLHVSSSYNRIYSDKLVGASFVRFLVFFLPFFHSAKAITDMISIVQYKDQSVHMDDFGSVALSYTNGDTSTFDAEGISVALATMAYESIMYLFFAWLASQLLSSGFSEGRSLYTLLPPCFRRSTRMHREDETLIEGDVRGEERMKSKEERSVRAYKVSKTYSGVQALKEVSFSMKRGEVFAMLGHNGAGKSTLINIITGLIAPTHGKVYMNGLDVEEDAAEVQQIIGVCAQDDLLWDDLTAREHMLLTAAFKGIAFGEKLFNAVENVLGMVQLQDRAEDFCRQFSGGMKRRLSVAMSTVGDVDILFFDEPTTGLDPVSRRHVWNAINRMKEDRVVVLTTHNMEEADFLADTIMIMHSGKVRAFGDPLFLKQTFGKGYQVHLVVHQEAMLETRDVISHVLPVSHCQLDELSKSIAVTVPRDDVRGLPRLFSWLEKSDRAAQIIVEWGISNTTLEQVFLLLCVQNTEVNTNSAMSDANEEARRCICPMCGERQKENVFMRSRGGVMMIVPESLCWACAESNPHYIISEEDVSHALEDADHISERVALLRSQADARAETAATSAILESEDMTFLQEGEWNETLHIAGEGVAEEKADTVMSPLEEHSAVEVDEGVCKKEGTVLAEVGSEHQIIYAQMKAIIVKNVVLQGRQKCSNICSVIFVSLMFMLLYIMGLLFTEGEGVKQCSEGYLTDQDCSTATIVGHIFSGASGNMVDDYWWDDDDAVGSYGYNVKNILVPSPSGVFIFGGSNNDANYYSSYGLPYYHYRDPIIWTSMMNSTTLMDSSSLGLYILGREVPSAAESDANHYVYSKQDATYASTLSNGYPECKSYAPNTLVGTETTSTDEVVQVFSDMFADAAFVCPQCTAYPPGYVDPNRTVFFNGSFWMTNINKNYCSKQNCAKYPYGFINFISSELTNSTDYLGDDDGKCPLGIATMELNFDGGREQTMIAMTYLNLLTNLLNDPNLQTYSIQGGYSRYGDLDYDTEEVSQNLSNLLTLAAMMLLNGFWPMAVWRLAHEQSLDIVLMMRTVGMKASSYIWGMFLFDMAISLVSGIAMIVFAVQLNLSQFADAPIDYMVAIVLASALSLNAMSLCIVKLLGKRSSIMPMVAPCLCVAAAAGTSLLNVFAYPNDGEWPWPLSIVPFLAQGRALYIVLVYQQGSEESDTALALLFITAGIFLLVAYVVEANIDIIAKLKKKWKKFRGKDKGRRSRASSAHTPVEISLAPFAHAEDDIATACDAAEYAHLDIDVATEKRTAMMYDPPSSIDEQQTFAIVLQKLQHVFPNGMEAVKELSMALKYGECFGLLGPNGAGKSTTISILSGTLRATRGDIYVGGASIRETTTAIHKYVGICPQFDVVWNDLTVSEHLTFQARQRGITESHIIAEVQKAAVAVGLDGDGFFTKASELSGGMRRRLSIAMSTVGNPPIIFMDEPTTGLDPDNRQAVWKIIQQLKTPNRLLLLTTHSMEEAEALCSRIGIMARGQLQCVGSAAHLKTKYGKGYVLTVNLLPWEEQSKLEELLSDFVIHQLSRGSATLLSSINRTHKYLLPTENNSVHISEVFKEMELNKEQLAIREWGLSMSTLEDVFISAVQAD